MSSSNEEEHKNEQEQLEEAIEYKQEPSVEIDPQTEEVHKPDSLQQSDNEDFKSDRQLDLLPYQDEEEDLLLL